MVVKVKCQEIKNKIKEQGFKSIRVAELIGVDKSTLWRKLENKAEFNLSELYVLSKILDTEMIELVEVEENAI